MSTDWTAFQTQDYDFAERSERHDTGSSHTITWVEEESTREWIRLFTQMTGCSLQFFAANMLRLFLHVRQNFEEDHGEAREKELSIRKNTDFLEFQFPYVAPILSPPREEEFFWYRTPAGELEPMDRELAKDERPSGWELVKSEKIVTKRLSYPVHPTLVEQVQDWAKRDQRTDAAAYHTGCLLLGQWMKSNQSSLGYFDSVLRVDDDWEMEPTG